MNHLETYFQWAGTGLEGLGVGIIVLGALYSTVVAILEAKDGTPRKQLFRLYRRQFGKTILLGLEFLVAGDIINTVAMEPSFTSVGILSIIVLIRTFLSFTLEVEMTGKWPWQGIDKDM